MKNPISWVKKHSLFVYFFLAFIFSWLIEIPLALQTQGYIKNIYPGWFHYLAGYGPLLSVLIVMMAINGRDGLKEIWKRMTRWRVHPLWWMIALSPFFAYVIINLTFWMFGGKSLGLLEMGQVEFLPPIGLGAIPLWILTFGIGEETGWRGFALPRLQKKFNAITATIILWVIWAFWHLPLFFYSYEVSIIPGMLIGLLAGAITFTWLYNSTSGSILIVAIWHGLFDFTTACSQCQTSPVAAIISALVMIWAVLVVILFKPKNLSSFERQIN
jgi:uncharacterized protein